MSVMLRKQRNGKIRKHWYGEYKDGEKRKVINLNVVVRGTPPESLRKPGDAEFEASRRKAVVELERFAEDARRKGRVEHLTERLIEAKTGRAVEYVGLEELEARWRSMGRDSEPSEAYLKSCDATFRKFREFMAERKKSAKYLYEVERADAEAYLKLLQGMYAPKTVRDHVKLLNKAFARHLPVGTSNPFADLVGRRTGGGGATVHREPFSAEELEKLLDAARRDDFLYPLVVTAACTGMRRGDVCRLRWESVNLKEGVLEVKTSKTGASVEIPIFGLLREVLESRQKDEDLVFPEAAEMAEKNPDGLTWRFKKLVAVALAEESEKQSGDSEERVEASEMKEEGLETIRESFPAGKRRDRMMEVFGRYAEGESLRDIHASTGIAKGTVSLDLNRVQAMLGKQFLPGSTSSVRIKMREATQVKRGKGQRAASVRDWHALRATFVTLALSAGVPMELVRRVTGHATVEVVVKHYFRPDREAFKSALVGAMPEVLTGAPAAQDKEEGIKDKGEEMVALSTKVAAGTATEEEKGRLKELAASLG